MTKAKKSVRPKPPANYNDNPPLTEARLRRMRPAAELVPEIVAEFKRRVGRPTQGNKPKVPVSLRLDPDVLDAYKRTGEGWQRRINETLARGAAKLRAKA